MKSKQLQEILNGISPEIKQAFDIKFELYQRRLFEFTEWVGYNYVRLHGTWVHKYADQREKANYKTTVELFDIWVNDGIN